MLTQREKTRYAGFPQRVRNVAVVMALAFGVLVMRLWDLQVNRGQEFAQKAEQNRTQFQPLESTRGMIYGRDKAGAGDEDVVLADNRPACDIVLVPADCEEPEAVAHRLEDLIGIDGAALLEAIGERERQPYSHIRVKRDVTRADLTRVSESSHALPGVFTVVQPQRRYIHGKTAGQILGYLGEIGPEELERKRDLYKLGDLVGKSGLERAYETLLHGRDGEMLVTKFAAGAPQVLTDAYGRPYIRTDSMGHELKEERRYRREPVPGKTLYLNLDIGLQALCEKLLEGEVGAITVLDADTGAVLALASSPGYDPSVFVTRGRNKERFALLNDTSANPMKSRCFQEAYAPGSVFKVLMASAALEEGVIDENTTFFCGSRFELSGHTWRCWSKYGHGKIAVVNALAFSCDVFFYNVGLELGIDRINEWGEKMGLGVKTGIDLPNEATGLVPSRASRREQRLAEGFTQPWDLRWYPGDTVNLAIGQGDLHTTPLQNAVLMASIVNGGYRVQPYLNRELEPVRQGPFLSEKTLDIVRRGMRKCVEKGPPAPTGTGHIVHIPDKFILGKTGTAQIVSRKVYAHYENEEDIPRHFRDHAFFVAGVMGEDPRLAISIAIEHGLHGGSSAGPPAKAIIEYYFSDPEKPVAIARVEEAP